MKTYNLKPHYTFDEAKKRAGEWVTDKDYDLLISDETSSGSRKFSLQYSRTASI